MNRLTKKVIIYPESRKDGTIIKVEGIVPTYKGDIYKKLYELENIEEEFGCPLDAIFKALKDRKLVSINTISSEKPEITLGIYKILGLMFDGENYVLYIYKDNDLAYVYTKDFGKTWMIYDIEVKNE